MIECSEDVLDLKSEATAKVLRKNQDLGVSIVRTARST